MSKRLLGAGALALVASLTLAACAQPQEESEGGIDEVDGNSVIDAIEDELSGVDTVTADSKDLFFDNGFYILTYIENPLDEESSEVVTAEGIISFREDGSCAFDASGEQQLGDGTQAFTYVKDFSNSGSLKYEDQEFDFIDPAEIEANLSLVLSPVGPYVRSADFSGFCGVQAMSEYVDRAGRSPGTGDINGEKAADFLDNQRDAYYGDLYKRLGANDYTYEEAVELFSVTYPGSEIMPRVDSELRFGTDSETGVVTIEIGTEGTTDIATLTLDPRAGGSKERALEYVQQYEGTWGDQIDFFIETYGSGDEYLASIDVN